jgi:hypothetical protein
MKGSPLIKFSLLLALLLCAMPTAHAFSIVGESDEPEEDLTAKDIEMEFLFVEYELSDIDLASIQGRLSIESLTELRKEGKAKLIAAPRVKVKSGLQATVKGVDEVIYPASFDVSYADSTNSDAVVVLPMIPDTFQTREVGVIVEVYAEPIHSNDTIHVTITAEIVSEPEWHTEKMSFTDETGIERRTTVTQPFFHVAIFTTSLDIMTGSTVLAGGGLKAKDPEKVIYCFVSATILATKTPPAKE